jgi:tyrosine-protein kinase Etk/Wzc
VSRTDVAGATPRAYEATISDYARVVWRHRSLVLAVLTLALCVAVAITITTPKRYEASATLITPRENASTGLLSGLAAASGLLQQVPATLPPSLVPNRDLILGILKSRSVAQAVSERFGLAARYRVRYSEDAVRRVRNATTVVTSREGVISVTVEDTDPKLAAEMANFYVEEVDRRVAQYNIGEAGRQRAFLSQQLARPKADLDQAEQSLRRFQEQNRAIVLQEQTRGAIEAAARLKGEILAAEVQLQVIRNFATDANPEVMALRRRIDEMNRQFGQMQYGAGGATDTGDRRRDFTVPFAKVPELGLELARLTREVKVQETLVALLTQHVEQARLAEAKDLPFAQVLDRAVPAERHSRPRLSVNLAIGGAIGFAAGCLLAFIGEARSRLRKRLG